MSDSIAELRAAVVAFRDKRDWRQFHNPKDLAISLVLEASELLENFQWKNAEEVSRVQGDEAGRARLSDEVADVAIYLLSLCDVLEIDLGRAVLDKLARNERRYPTEKVKGSAEKPETA